MLLDTFSTEIASSNIECLETLKDISDKIQIQPSFCIQHSDYQRIELPAEAVARFQKLPSEIQERYRCLLLRNFLYGIYYNNSQRDRLTLDNKKALAPNLENNTFLDVNLEFFDRLHQSNQGTGYFDPDWLILRQEADQSLAVAKGGLTLHIQRDRHLRSTDQSARVGDAVAIRMPANLIQNGFYMAVGNAGTESRHHSDCATTVRVYFNFSPEGAVAVMASLTQQLNDFQIPFSFKVLYNPSDYHRYDSGVLYFDRSHYNLVRAVLQAVYSEDYSYFQSDIPLFTKRLAHGLGLAEEPNHKFSAQESFGMNRCQIVANALLAARRSGDESLESRIASIYQHFDQLGLALKQPYLNANSEDLYSPLSLCK